MQSCANFINLSVQEKEDSHFSPVLRGAVMIHLTFTKIMSNKTQQSSSINLKSLSSGHQINLILWQI